MKSTLAAIIFFAFSFSLQAQQEMFNRVFYDTVPESQGGITSTSIAHASDNGYLIAGTSAFSSAFSSGFVINADSMGHALWNKTYSVTNSTLQFNQILATNDASYMLLGTLNNSVAFMKINASGDILWTKTISNTGYNLNPVSGEQTADSGFIISGYTSENAAPFNRAFVARTDVNGELLWTKIFTFGNYSHTAFSVKQTADSGFLIIGNYSNCSPCYTDAFLIKLNPSGIVHWSKKYKATSTNYNYGYDFLNLADGYLCYINSGLMKVDFEGNVLWYKSYQQFYVNNSIEGPGPKLLMCSDSTYLLLRTDPMGMEGSMLKTDPNGNILWVDNLFLSASDVMESKQKELLVVGNGPIMGLKGPKVDSPQIGLIQTNSLGQGLDCVWFNNIMPLADTIISSPVTFSEISGGTVKTISPQVASLNILEYNGCVDYIGGIGELDKTLRIKVFPNPAKETLVVDSEIGFKDAILTVYNVNMQLVYQQVLKEKQTALDISEYSSGLYFVKIKSDKTVGFSKFVKE
jgi:hypothetical protein